MLRSIDRARLPGRPRPSSNALLGNRGVRAPIGQRLRARSAGQRGPGPGSGRGSMPPSPDLLGTRGGDGGRETLLTCFLSRGCRAEGVRGGRGRSGRGNTQNPERECAQIPRRRSGRRGRGRSPEAAPVKPSVFKGFRLCHHSPGGPESLCRCDPVLMRSECTGVGPEPVACAHGLGAPHPAAPGTHSPQPLAVHENCYLN